VQVFLLKENTVNTICAWILFTVFILWRDSFIVKLAFAFGFINKSSQCHAWRVSCLCSIKVTSEKTDLFSVRTRSNSSPIALLACVNIWAGKIRSSRGDFR